MDPYPASLDLKKPTRNRNGSDNWDPWAAIQPTYNLGAALTQGQVQRGHGKKTALLWENAAGRHKSFTYGELETLTTRLASSLAKRGVRRGDRVFLRLPNLPEFYITALAIAKLGAVFIPSSTQFRESEIPIGSTMPKRSPP